MNVFREGLCSYRLARSLDDLRKLVTNWNNDGITVYFHKEGFNFTADENTPIAELLGAVAQFERSLIRERQAEGIAKAVKKGKYKGRQTNVERNKKIRFLRKEGWSIRKIAEELGCNSSTV